MPSPRCPARSASRYFKEQSPAERNQSEKPRAAQLRVALKDHQRIAGKRWRSNTDPSPGCGLSSAEEQSALWSSHPPGKKPGWV